MDKIFRMFLSFFLSLTLVSGILFAQSRESGLIKGIILDNEEVPLPGVTIIASSPSLMGTRSAITDHEGEYRFPALPGGNYTIEVSLEGFTSVIKKDIILHVGMTATINIVLSVKKLQEQITVTGSAPLIDVTDASIAKTFLTQDVLQNIPNAQDVSQIFLLAPGSVSGPLFEAYVYGGSRLSNSYQIDGVELTDSWASSGTYTAPIDYNVIEEAQIMGLGAPAEYGNFTGAVANIITKSGGNTLSGDVQILYKGIKWQSKNKNINEDDPHWSLLPESPVTSLFDPSFHLGGPFIKDKLWFFGGFEYYSTKDKMQSIDMTRDVTFPKVFFKLTFQADEKNKFKGFFEYHNRTAHHTIFSKLAHPEAQRDLLYPVYAGNFSFLHMFSPSTIFDLKVTGYSMIWEAIPSSRDRNIAGHYDLATGEMWGNCYYWSHWYSSRLGASAMFSHSVDKFIIGSHDFKLGVEFERSPGGGKYDFNGPDKVVYYDYNGMPSTAMKMVYKQGAVNVRYSFYAQDSWKITKSFVLNPGLRFDVIRGSIPDLNKTVYKPTGLEPRIGFVWDIFKNQDTLLKAHYGRYLEATKTYNFAQMTPMSDTTFYAVGPDWSTLSELYKIPGVDLYYIDPKIKHPSADQIVVGVEKVFGKDLSASISFIYKVWNNFIDPVNTGGIFETIPYTDPDTGEVYTIYNELDPSQDHYYITNPKKGEDIGAAYPDIVGFTPDRKYKALQISLTKRLSNNWQMFASYVYSQEKGSYSSGNIPGMTTVFIDPNNQINNYGCFASSIPHIFKLQFSYFLPLGISLSGFYVYCSGVPWTKRLSIQGLNQGNVNILAEAPGSRRMPNTNNLDLRIEKSFYYRNKRLSLMVDIFNLFNRGVETAVYSTSGSNFAKPTEVITPRGFRAGLRFVF